MFTKKTNVHFGYNSDKGRVREINEDSLGWFDPGEDKPALQSKGRLFIVADGMGGYSAGEVASELAVKTVVEGYKGASGKEILQNLSQAIQAANTIIYRQAQSGGQAGMGTTIICAVIRSDELYTAHVGDSRIYLYHDKHLKQLTEDHTIVNELLHHGLITADEARNHPQQHVINRALGKVADAEPTLAGPIPLQHGDLILLCTDGISGSLEDSQIEDMLGANLEDPKAAAVALTQSANAAGGHDNATAFIIRIERSFFG